MLYVLSNVAMIFTYISVLWLF